ASRIFQAFGAAQLGLTALVSALVSSVFNFASEFNFRNSSATVFDLNSKLALSLIKVAPKEGGKIIERIGGATTKASNIATFAKVGAFRTSIRISPGIQAVYIAILSKR